MDDKDKEAFYKAKEIFHGGVSPMNDVYGNLDLGFKNGWQYACKYKQKEIDLLYKYIEKLSIIVGELNLKLKELGDK